MIVCGLPSECEKQQNSCESPDHKTQTNLETAQARVRDVRDSAGVFRGRVYIVAELEHRVMEKFDSVGATTGESIER